MVLEILLQSWVPGIAQSGAGKYNHQTLTCSNRKVDRWKGIGTFRGTEQETEYGGTAFGSEETWF